MLARLFSLVIVIGVAGCAAPASAPASKAVERSHVAMGSSLRLSAWTTDEAATVAVFEQVFREFDRLESLLSVWRPGSDVIRINEAAGKQPVKVNSDTIAVLEAAAQASEWTGGKFDITFGTLADIWKFDHDQDNTVPDRRAIEARLPFVDYHLVQVDHAASTAFITKAGARIHLGGIGKGYAVDRAAALLRERGLTDFLIQSGGDLYVAGRNGDVPWTLGIADPRNAAGPPFAKLEVSDGTVSTSGDYERFFFKDGRRYHHIIDPDLGEPARLCRSVTIISNRATLADVLSKGVFLLGPEQGMALIERIPDVEAVIVTASNQVLISSGLQGRVQIVAPPTDAP